MSDRPTDELPDWEKLLAAERHLQQLVPGTVLVGGSAAAIHLLHRVSLDGDHTLADLRDRFDAVLADLEAASGWTTERLVRPVLVLGRLDGVMTGVRQLKRSRPLDTEIVGGLRVPTLAEMARIKAWLLVTRNTTRDFLDTVVLLERLGENGAAEALASLDEIYSQPNGASPLVELAERLEAGRPGDLGEIDLRTYKGLVAPWNDWTHVHARGKAWATVVSRSTLGRSDGAAP